MKKIFLKRLRLIGKGKNYEVVFQPGLNYITGPTSTGKTSILELIDYVLGSKKHKAYIEIGEKCTDVELELDIDEQGFKISRRLFDFSLPVRIDEWDYDNNAYRTLGAYDIDISSNKKSLSAFLINQLGLADIKISNQQLSFRDLLKYSYLKQTEIDSEDLMHEKHWAENNKRRATFEVIYGIHDDLLAQLKEKLKTKTDEQEKFKIQLEGVNLFIEKSQIGDVSAYRKKKSEIEDNCTRLKERLVNVKYNQNDELDGTKELRDEIVKIKTQLSALNEHIIDRREYIDKLKLLLNQYQIDITKDDMLLVGVPEINKYEFVSCPNCHKPIKKSDDNHCSICGQEMDVDIDEQLLIKKHRSSLKRRLTELSNHIYNEQQKIDCLVREADFKTRSLKEKEEELSHLQSNYVNPFIEEIEKLNYEIGNSNRILNELDNNLRMLEEHDLLEKDLREKENIIIGIKASIKNAEDNSIDKDSVISNLSKQFNADLKAFQFPKLDTGYINEKDYLPYVRGRKYNELGSLGGVTLIVMAYYLSILETSLEDKYHHLNFLMIDSPRKNLGVDATQEEFRDEKIFNSVIRKMMDFCQENRDSVQLIVVNNGYPDFLPKENIIVEFDPNKRIGLVDDAK